MFDGLRAELRRAGADPFDVQLRMRMCPGSVGGCPPLRPRTAVGSLDRSDYGGAIVGRAERAEARVVVAYVGQPLPRCPRSVARADLLVGGSPGTLRPSDRCAPGDAVRPSRAAVICRRRSARWTAQGIPGGYAVGLRALDRGRCSGERVHTSHATMWR